MEKNIKVDFQNFSWLKEYTRESTKNVKVNFHNLIIAILLIIDNANLSASKEENNHFHICDYFRKSVENSKSIKELINELSDSLIRNWYSMSDKNFSALIIAIMNEIKDTYSINNVSSLLDNSYTSINAFYYIYFDNKLFEDKNEENSKIFFEVMEFLYEKSQLNSFKTQLDNNKHFLYNLHEAFNNYFVEQ